MNVKISIIGAGSAVFSLNLVKDLCLNKNLAGATISLMDVNPERLEAIYGLCSRYVQETGNDFRVEKTTDRRECLRGADFVVNVALDYGHKRLREGWKTAYKNGYHFGGSLHIVHDEAFWVNFYQLRLMESILQDALEICPQAWYILVANPVQAGITYLSRKYPQAKLVGMCHGYNGANMLAEAMGLERKDVHFEVSGVNHFIWLTSLTYRGEDAYPLLDKWLEDGSYERYHRSHDRKSADIGPKSVDLYRRYGVFPIGDTCTPGGGSWGWWYHTDEAAWNEDPYASYEDYFANGERQVEKIRRAALDLQTPVTKAFSDIPSDEPMVPLIEALACDVERTVIVNVPNAGGFVPGVPTDYEVEINALVSKRGIEGIRMNPLPGAVLSHLLRDRVAPVETELLAFQTGDMALLEDLVMMDPWTKSLQQARGLIDDILNLPFNAEMKAYFQKK